MPSAAATEAAEMETERIRGGWIMTRNLFNRLKSQNERKTADAL